jgi:acetyl-CoA carboxylase beta subunit
MKVIKKLKEWWNRDGKCPSCNKFTFKDSLNDDFYECSSCGYIEDRFYGFRTTREEFNKRFKK